MWALCNQPAGTCIWNLPAHWSLAIEKVLRPPEHDVGLSTAAGGGHPDMGQSFKTPRVSVILCTHNPRADYLRRTLDSLRGQGLALDRWEFLLVDNASRIPLADSWDVAWHSQGRHIREEELGLTPARLRGIAEARGDLLVFVDDDNVLAADYLEQAVCIWEQYRHLGVFGAGVLEPEFEVPPPSELTHRLFLLALRDHTTALWSNNFQDWGSRPVGAGMCVAREVAECFRQVIEQLRVTELLGRRGQHLFCGEDDLFSWVSVKAGLGFGVFPELCMKHLISAGRLKREYFVRLIRGHAYSHGVLRFLLDGNMPRRLNLTRYLRLFLHAARNGWFSMQCQWAESKGEAGAAQFIAKNGLHPIQTTLLPQTKFPSTGAHRGSVREQPTSR